jgi:hypothetical protein
VNIGPGPVSSDGLKMAIGSFVAAIVVLLIFIFLDKSAKPAALAPLGRTVATVVTHSL